MNNCIFTAHCMEQVCDNACPILAETSYLLERNRLSLDNAVFNTSQRSIDAALTVLHKCNKRLGVIESDSTITSSNLITYCSICENWYGNCLHCSVYHLQFSNYIDTLQKSWSAKNPIEALEYEQIWVSSAKILIISNLDYVQFKDFQAQTLLNLLHTRENNGFSTIIVSPKISTLIGSGLFFNKLQSVLKGAIVTW